ncbi:hypothetical protein MAJ_06435, partial [Metarhizium majus ARSEF 297]
MRLSYNPSHLPLRRQASDVPASPPTTRPTPPGISYELFIGFLWAGVAIATIFIASRLYARSRTSRRLYLDDLFISFAYVLVVVTAALWQWGAKDMYYILNANAGLVQVGPDFVTRMRRFLLVSFIAEMFFYTILMLFKLSLLFFVKRLGSSVDRFKYFWWPTLVFSMCTYLVAVGDIDYKCLFATLEDITVRCNSPSGTYFLKVTLDVNCALHIRLGKKIALFGLFSLSIITMAVAIARAADIGATQKSNGLPDSTYLWFWSSLQSFLCIVVSCAAASRQLFVASTRSNSTPLRKPTRSCYERMASNFRSRRHKPNDTILYDMPSTRQTGKGFNAFDYVAMRDGSEADSQHDSQSPVLVPRLGKPVAACYKAPDQNHTQPNHITKEVEFRVTQHTG